MSTKPYLKLLVTDPLITGQDDTISEIPLDVRLSSTVNHTATVTDNPVEEGSIISDHVQVQPTSMELEGFVSDTPITTVPLAPPNLKGDRNEDRPTLISQGAYDAIMAVFRNAVPLTVVREYETLEDMVITDFRQSKSQDRGNGLWFTMSLRKIVTVKTLSGALPADVVAKLKRRRAKTVKDTPQKTITIRDKSAKKGQKGRQATITVPNLSAMQHAARDRI